MSDDANKSILLVKKADSKKGSLWNMLTNGRIIKQHGGFDIPEGDLHAVPKYQSPIEGKESSPEETKETLSDLEKEIQLLKEKDMHETRERSPQQQSSHDYKDQDDDLF